MCNQHSKALRSTVTKVLRPTITKALRPTVTKALRPAACPRDPYRRMNGSCGQAREQVVGAGRRAITLFFCLLLGAATSAYADDAATLAGNPPAPPPTQPMVFCAVAQPSRNCITYTQNNFQYNYYDQAGGTTITGSTSATCPPGYTLQSFNTNTQYAYALPWYKGSGSLPATFTCCPTAPHGQWQSAGTCP